jgi:hypothetical protein
MYKTITLASGHEVDLHFGSRDSKRVLDSVRLRYGRITLGGLLLCDNGAYKPPHHAYWYDKIEEVQAAIYYRTKYPDLADKDPELLFKEGFAREADLDPVIERAHEMARALNQDGSDRFCAINAAGEIVADGDTAYDACCRAQYRGWRGWYSPDRADEHTLRIVPADKV